MAYKVIILYRLYMPSYFLGTFTEYPPGAGRRWRIRGDFNPTVIPSLPFLHCNPLTINGDFAKSEG